MPEQQESPKKVIEIPKVPWHYKRTEWLKHNRWQSYDAKRQKFILHDENGKEVLK